LLSFEALSLKPVTQLLPSLILVKADQAQTLALHTTLQLLASEMAEEARAQKWWPTVWRRFCSSRRFACILHPLAKAASGDGCAPF
jgi:hypothetical protein